MARVVNKHRHTPTAADVYIGRGSKWGNPFVIGKDGDRAEVVEKYREWITERPDLIESIFEIKGKNLVCFCKPAACHGDILCEILEVAQEIENEK